jgi:predicted ATP-grasp superfamily ATP-dependent carboligase
MTNTVPAAAFENIQISVKPDPEKEGQYIVVAYPADPTLTKPNTIVNYQIIDTDGDDITFTGMTVKPHHNGQLSPATVSVDGKMLTFSDINTVKMTLNINLKFINHDKGGLEFAHDPQVQNDPQKPPMC